MPAQKALGFVTNVIHQASGIHVSLKNAQGVLFVVYEDGGATQIGIKESIAGASEQNLAVVNELYASNGIGGVWTRETTDANGSIADGDAAIVKKDTTAFDCAAFHVRAEELSDGFDSVEVTVDAGQCTAFVYGLKVQRDIINLPAAGV